LLAVVVEEQEIQELAVVAVLEGIERLNLLLLLIQQAHLMVIQALQTELQLQLKLIQ
tara:strand:+ start:89 stop:259 length:171 start_codon:yes stop_codon:yes gene_type:complete